MAESYSYIYNKINFNQILLVCSPLKKCMEYKRIVNMVLGNADYIYVHIETFMDEFIEALHNKSVDKFKQKYTICKLLFLRDIHFLTNKISTQEEVYNIIKTRIENNLKTIVISSVSSEELSKTLTPELYELLSLEHINDDLTSLKNESSND